MKPFSATLPATAGPTTRETSSSSTIPSLTLDSGLSAPQCLEAPLVCSPEASSQTDWSAISGSTPGSGFCLSAHCWPRPWLWALCTSRLRELLVSFFLCFTQVPDGMMGGTSRPTSESSSKELNNGCKLNQTWTNPGPDLTWTLPNLSLTASPLPYPV